VQHAAHEFAEGIAHELDEEAQLDRVAMEKAVAVGKARTAPSPYP